jgi:hypothetical protein
MMVMLIVIVVSIAASHDEANSVQEVRYNHRTTRRLAIDARCDMTKNPISHERKQVISGQ